MYENLKFILEYLNSICRTSGTQFEVLGVKSKHFGKIRKIRQGISENTQHLSKIYYCSQLKQALT